MISFQYKQVSDELLQRFVELLETGESIVLLGPRCVGKKYVLARLVEQLLERGGGPIGYVRFFEPGLESFDDQNNATDVGADHLQLLSPDIDVVIDWLRRRATSPGVGIICFSYSSAETLTVVSSLTWLEGSLPSSETGNRHLVRDEGNRSRFLVTFRCRPSARRTCAPLRRTHS